MKKSFVYKGENYEIEFEVNDWAERSLISLLTKSGETVILTTVNLGEELPHSDFLPLTIDYEEKFYAVGKIFGSRFIRREGKSTLSAILNARLIDRSIRSIFHPYFRKKIHIVNTVISYDQITDPAFLALLGTSFSLKYLGLPLIGSLAGIKVVFDGQEWKISPSSSTSVGSEILGSLFISGTKNKINMIEFEGIEVEEKEVLKGIKIAFEEIKRIISFFENNLTENNQEFYFDETPYKEGEEILEKFLIERKINLREFLFSNEEGDRQWQSIFELLSQEDFKEKAVYVVSALQKKFKKIFQKEVLENKIRTDGRKLDEIRKISIDVNVLPRAHGSALFKRGLTHILSTVTLAGPGEELVLREIEYEGLKRFIHHYNFPPFSTGEIGSYKGPSRREIGHGELAEKALRNLIPPQEEFPYTIRVVSDVLSSNGSTSMGSVCGSSLALMSAGVPLKKHVSGISIGLVYEDDENYELLTDIQGPEDFFGGMDFKIAMTDKGINAIQLDVKIEGLNLEQIEKAFTRAREANNFILNLMNEKLPQPLPLTPLAPKVETFKIDPLKIGLVIGTGGKTINEIIGSTNTKITIEPTGIVYIIGDKDSDVELAKNWVKIIAEGLNVGEIVKGKVVKILPTGAILEITPQKTAFLHISEIADKKIENIENEIKIGDNLYIMVKKVTSEGKIYVSLKDARRREEN